MKSNRLALFTIAIILIVGVVFAATQKSDDKNLLLEQLQADEWRQRAKAVELLTSNRSVYRSDEAKKGLIDLLNRENQLIGTTLRESNGLEGVSVKYGEGYSEYYAELLGAVDQIADYNDSRILNIMVHSSYNPDSPFAKNLASHGEAVVPALLEMANSDLGAFRGNAIAVLGDVLDGEKYRTTRMSADTDTQIRQALIRGVDDPDVGVRILAVQSLGKAGGADAVQLLRRIAASDPAMFPADASGRSRYPVREEALKAISLIKNREKHKPM